MSNAHAKLVADMDATRVNKAATAMERDLAAFSQSAKREFSKADKAHAAFASEMVSRERKALAAMGRRGIGMEKLGAGAVGAANLARSFNTATSASSQLAMSAAAAGAWFGPKGMIVAGVVATGFAMKENLELQKESVRLAQMEFTVRERARDQAARRSAILRDEAVAKEADALELQRRVGKDFGIHQRRGQLDADIAAIEKRQDLPQSIKDSMIGNLQRRARAEGALELQQGKRGRDEAMIEGVGDPVAEKARRYGLGVEGRRAEDRAQRQLDRDMRRASRSIADQEDQKRRNRPDFTNERNVAREEAAKANREAVLEGAGKAKRDGVTRLSPEDMDKLATSITTGMAKEVAKLITK